MAAPARYPTTKGVTENAMNGLIGYLMGLPHETGFGSASTAERVSARWDGTGQVAIITGASSGLGAESARVLAARGCEVVLAVRDLPKCQKVVAAIRAQQPGALLTPMELHLDSLESVRAFAKAFLATGKRLDILMCNAGIMGRPFDLSKDGHEMQFATNHLGHFLLAKLLLPHLEATARQAGKQGRLVVMSSSAHFMPYPPRSGGPIRLEDIDSPKGYHRMTAYGQSKLCNLLFVRELHRQLGDSPVAAVACHPGVIDTELGVRMEAEMKRWLPSKLIMEVIRTLTHMLGKSVHQGAATQVFAATAPKVVSGDYYADCSPSPSSHAAHSVELGGKLWELSERLCAPFCDSQAPAGAV